MVGMSCFSENRSRAAFALFLGAMVSPLASREALASLAIRQVYVVRQGDTLSRVAQCLVGTPVYPSGRGSLSRLLVENPRLSRSSLIVPGDRVVLPAAAEDYTPPERFGCGVRFSAELALRDSGDSLARGAVAELPTVEIGATERQEEAAAGQSLSDQPVVEKLTTESKIQVESHFQFDAETGYVSVTGTTPNGAQGTLASDLVVGARVSWLQNWGTSWTTGLSLFGSYVSFLPVDGRRLVNSPFLATGFHIEVNRRLGLFSVGVQAGSQQQIFYTTPSVSEIAIHRVTVPVGSVRAAVQLLQVSSLTLSGEGRAGVLLSGASDDFTVQSGLHYGGGVFIRDGRIEGGAFYHWYRQDTSLLSVSRSDFGVQMRLRWGGQP